MIPLWRHLNGCSPWPRRCYWTFGDPRPPWNWFQHKSWNWMTDWKHWLPSRDITVLFYVMLLIAGDCHHFILLIFSLLFLFFTTIICLLFVPTASVFQPRTWSQHSLQPSNWTSDWQQQQHDNLSHGLHREEKAPDSAISCWPPAGTFRKSEKEDGRSWLSSHEAICVYMLIMFGASCQAQQEGCIL